MPPHVKFFFFHCVAYFHSELPSTRTDYKLFGTQLLKDSDGSKVCIIEMKHQDPVDTVVEIRTMATRKGKYAHYMANIVQMLARDRIKCSCKKMETSLSEHNRDSDNLGVARHYFV